MQIVICIITPPKRTRFLELIVEYVVDLFSFCFFVAEAVLVKSVMVFLNSHLCT